MTESEPDKKRLLVSRDTRTDVWTDDQGDTWKPYYVEDKQYVGGAWLVFTRGNNYELLPYSIHADELDARRIAMTLIDHRAECLFVPWGDKVLDPALSSSSGLGTDRG